MADKRFAKQFGVEVIEIAGNNSDWLSAELIYIPRTAMGEIRSVYFQIPTGCPVQPGKQI